MENDGLWGRAAPLLSRGRAAVPTFEKDFSPVIPISENRRLLPATREGIRLETLADGPLSRTHFPSSNSIDSPGATRPPP